jgi:hypothetical protein
MGGRVSSWGQGRDHPRGAGPGPPPAPPAAPIPSWPRSLGARPVRTPCTHHHLTPNMPDETTLSTAADLDLAEALLQRLEQPTTDQDRALVLALDGWCSYRLKAELQQHDRNS